VVTNIKTSPPTPMPLAANNTPFAPGEIPVAMHPQRRNPHRPRRPWAIHLRGGWTCGGV